MWIEFLAGNGESGRAAAEGAGFSGKYATKCGCAEWALRDDGTVDRQRCRPELSRYENALGPIPSFKRDIPTKLLSIVFPSQCFLAHIAHCKAANTRLLCLGFMLWAKPIFYTYMERFCLTGFLLHGLGYAIGTPLGSQKVQLKRDTYRTYPESRVSVVLCSMQFWGNFYPNSSFFGH